MKVLCLTNKTTEHSAKNSPRISSLELYRSPIFLVAPLIERNKEGVVTLSAPDEQVEIYYTLDGSSPTQGDTKYTAPFLVEEPTIVKTISFDPEDGKSTEPIGHCLDISKKDWKVLSVSSGDIGNSELLIDENPGTFWATDEKVSKPQEIVIDLGEVENLKGFTYWPIQERYPFGILTDFEFSVSTDEQNWQKVAAGEFANIVNSRLQQRIEFSSVKARYIKLQAEKVDDDGFRASFAEVGIITKE